MSGHKRATITISEEEYRRLHDAEMKLRFMPKRSTEPSPLNNQVQAAVFDHLDQVRQRQEAFSSVLDGFHGDIRHLEALTGSAIVASQERFAEEMSTAVGHLWEQTTAMLEEQSAHFEERIAAEHQARQSQLLAVQDSIAQLEMSAEHRHEKAGEWLHSANEVLGFICTSYYHEHFAPGAAARQEAQLMQAMDNLRSGFADAALMQAQQVYTALSELRVELEKREAEWNGLYQAAWEGVFQLLDSAHSAHTCSAHDLDGQELPVPVDVDYWSCGELSHAIEGVEQLALRLQEDGLSSQDLKAVLRDGIPTSQRGVEDAIYHARLAVLNSQLRINIADLVIEALQKQGYVLQESEYARDDQRMAFSARVRALDGSEIVIQVYPSDMMGKNELHLVSLDREQRTEHELRLRSMEVTRSLGQHGLKVDNLRAVGPRKQPASQPVQRERHEQALTQAQ